MSVPAVPSSPKGQEKNQTGVRSLESKKTPLQRTTLSEELSCVLTLKMTENIVTFLNQGLISKIGRDLEKIFIMFNNILKCYLIIYAIYICIQTPVFPTSLVLIFYGLFILSRFHVGHGSFHGSCLGCGVQSSTLPFLILIKMLEIGFNGAVCSEF